MTTAPQNASFPQAEGIQRPPLTLARVVAAMFLISLRESLDAQSSSDKSDGAFHYGL